MAQNGRGGFSRCTCYAGNSMKTLHISVEASLKKLRTDYIDILYIHWWDYMTSIEEVMNGLHALVLSGKVLYLGASDTPAWVVSQANQYARMSGKTLFAIYQGEWNVLKRDFERDILPMARAGGLALAPWGVLASGKIRTDQEERRRRETGEKGKPPALARATGAELLMVERMACLGRTLTSAQWERTETERAVVKVLEEVAAKVGTKNIQAGEWIGCLFSVRC
ncbi:Aldo/keto reductase [Lentinus tigrinus ALCF2SS1-6]|uniref:Aldo/keto reductase n=1 Tax=Lentinus tigrinus ALCF2SS1-6 TaxID=1328759 RepID=A0A5C2RNB2_9APHY|nr:Aldo/keto reductase [Lentinus tigrinus ALCF2SS1-6]